MDLFSAIIIILFIFFVIRGAWRGLSGELAPFAGILVCLGVLFASYHPIQEGFTALFPKLEANTTTFYAAIATALCGSLGFFIASALLRKLLTCIAPQPFNAIFGALIGGVKVFLFISLIGGLSTMGKNYVNEVRATSDQNPFLAVVADFWVEQFKTLPLVQQHLQQSTPNHTPGQTAKPHEKGQS
jgi:uncharacterized membrane protein required for colicin V production